MHVQIAYFTCISPRFGWIKLSFILWFGLGKQSKVTVLVYEDQIPGRPKELPTELARLGLQESRTERQKSAPSSVTSSPRGTAFSEPLGEWG